MADRRDKRRKHSSSATSATTASAATTSTSSKLDIDYLLNSSRTSNSSFVPLRTYDTPRTSRHPEAPPMFMPKSSRHIVQNPAKRKSKARPHECEICGFSFGQRSDRNKHIRTVHYRERPYSCEYCTQSFGEKGNLNKHIRALHQKSRPHKCTECNGQFAFHDGLQRHISMVHREARPFECPEPTCDKAFKQKAHAEKHFSSVHQKLKPCVCFCGAAFRENYNMKQHQRTVHNMNL